MNAFVALCILSMSSLFTPQESPYLSMPVLEVRHDEINTPEIQQLIDKMFTIARGEREDVQGKVMVGLAAIQIGVNKQIILVDVGFNSTKRAFGELTAFINPKITSHSSEKELGHEGCYSVDSDVLGIVERSTTITVSALDRYGNPVTQEFSGMTARIFQHEIDHLYGTRFPDRQECRYLHRVKEDEHPAYRTGWQAWPHSVSYTTWLSMKAGK